MVDAVGRAKEVSTKVIGSNPVLTTKIKVMLEKILKIKLLRTITLPIMCMFLVTYIIVAYVFDLEM